MRLSKPNSLRVQGPAKLLGYYLLFSAIWIITTDLVSHNLNHVGPTFNIFKGLIFISLSGAILWRLSRQLLEEANRLERTLSEIFEQSEFGVFLAEMDGRILDCNERCAELFGYHPEDLIGSNQLQLCNVCVEGADSPSRYLSESKSIREYKHRDGHTICVRLTASRTELKSGEVFIVGILQNVTNEVDAYRTLRKQQSELYQMSEVVKRSEARSKLLLETNLVGVVVASSDGQLLDANDQFLNMLGYTREELQNGQINWHVVTPPGFENADQKALQDLRTKHHVAPFEKEYIARDGTHVPVLISGMWIAENNAGVVEALISVIDLREIKSTEAQVSRLVLAVESAYENILITDISGNIVYVNRAFETLTGFTRNEVTGTNPDALLSDRTTKSEMQKIWQSVRAGQTWRGRLWSRRKDSSEYLEDATIAPVCDKSGKVINYLAVKKDITREHALEQRLIQSQKLEAVGQLAGGIAHDLNNVLQVVHSSAELGQRRTSDAQYVGKKFADVLRVSERGAAIIGQLLAFTRKEVLSPKLTNLNDVVKETSRFLRRLLPENIVLETKLSNDLWLVEADPVQLSQVVINLCVNARDAMPDGGTLQISTGNCREGAVRLSIQDTGVGMDQELQKKIFEPFFTTKAQGRGTGLGLSTVNEIVQRTGGHIAVDSALGRGTRFDVTFPASKRSMAATVDAAEQAVEPPTFSTAGIILVCEDDASVRAAVCEYLETMGLNVLRATNPVEAREIAARTEPEILISDVIMPGGSGVQLAAVLREKNPELKVLLITGHTEHDLLGSIRPDVNTKFLQKPFTAALLVEKLRELKHPAAMKAKAI